MMERKAKSSPCRWQILFHITGHAAWPHSFLSQLLRPIISARLKARMENISHISGIVTETPSETDI